MSGGFSNPFSVLLSRNAHDLLKGGRTTPAKKAKGGQKDGMALPREPRAVKVRVKDEQKKETPPVTREEEPVKKEPTKKEAKKETKKEPEPAKPNEKTEKELKKEEQAEAKSLKVEHDRTDRQDRSGKGKFVRKEGKGTGGWEDPAPVPEDAASPPEVPADEGPAWGASTTAVEASPPAVAEHADAPPREDRVPEVSEEERKRREDEMKSREAEEKQMTLDEYLEKKKDKAVEKASFNIRTVDESALSNMVKKKQKQDQVLRVNVKKPTPPPPPQPKPKASGEAKKVEKSEKKLDLNETGFRMENPAIRGGRGGRGGGREGGRGRGFARGRGAISENAVAMAEDRSAPQMDSEALFPALRAAPPKEGSPTAAAEKVAEPAA